MNPSLLFARFERSQILTSAVNTEGRAEKSSRIWTELHHLPERVPCPPQCGLRSKSCQRCREFRQICYVSPRCFRMIGTRPIEQYTTTIEPGPSKFGLSRGRHSDEYVLASRPYQQQLGILVMLADLHSRPYCFAVLRKSTLK